jgi:hypothetical protein
METADQQGNSKIFPSIVNQAINSDYVNVDSHDFEDSSKMRCV